MTAVMEDNTVTVLTMVKGFDFLAGKTSVHYLLLLLMSSGALSVDFRSMEFSKTSKSKLSSFQSCSIFLLS